MYLTWSAEEIINDPQLRAQHEVALLDVPPEVSAEVDRLLAQEKAEAKARKRAERAAREEAEPEDIDETPRRTGFLAHVERAVAKQRESAPW